MRRAGVLGTLVAVGTLSIAVSGQAPAGPSAKAVASTRIEKVRDNLYVIIGTPSTDPAEFSGGNTAVFITETGVTLVDTKLAGWGPTILDRLRTVTDKPVTRLINTHAHGDHTGSNEFFGASIETVVHENTRANMARMPAFSSGKAQYLPKRTYADRLTLGSGRDRIDLYHFGRGHTNGDTFVVFPAVRTVHVGDAFAWKALPFIDARNGGSVVEHPATLARLVAGVSNVDTVINGHMPVSTWNDLREFADFTQDFANYARASMEAGRSVDQAAAEYTVPSRFKDYIPSINPDLAGPKTNLRIAYEEMKR